MKSFPADLIWACAAAAQRTNGQYVKYSNTLGDGTVRESNRVLMLRYLAAHADDPALFAATVTDQDFEQGRMARDHVRGWLLRSLTGNVSTFERDAMALADCDQFDEHDSRWRSLLPCLPNSVARDQRRQDIDQRSKVNPALNVSVGDRYRGSVRVLDCSFSQNYGIYFVTAETESGSVVRFAHKKSHALDQRLNIQGRVREYRDTVAVLNRVRVTL